MISQLVLWRSKWTLVYAVFILAIVALVFGARRWAMRELSTSQARQRWSAWREDVKQQRDPQAPSVHRRVPRSAEPPALVLMRDYFVVCLMAAIGFCSLLFGITVWLLAGAISTSSSATGRAD